MTPTHILVKTSQVEVSPTATMPAEGATPAQLQAALNPKNVIAAFALTAVDGFTFQNGALLLYKGKGNAQRILHAYAPGEWMQVWQAAVPKQMEATKAPAPAPENGGSVESFPAQAK